MTAQIYNWNDFGPTARLDIPVQTRLSEAEARDLDDFVEWCQHRGIRASRSSALRTFVQAGLRAYKAEIDESPVSSNSADRQRTAD